MLDTRRKRSPRRRALRHAAMGSCLVLTLVATGGAPADARATPRTYRVEGQLHTRPGGTVRATGDFVGSYRSIWQNEQSAVEYGPTTLTVAEGVDGLTGCLDQNHDGRCGQGEPTGSITMAFRRVSVYRTTSHTLVESSSIRPIVGTTGQFTGGLLVVTERSTETNAAVLVTYRGELSANPF